MQVSSRKAIEFQHQVGKNIELNFLIHVRKTFFQSRQAKSIPQLVHLPSPCLPLPQDLLYTYTEICSPQLACCTYGAVGQEICHALLCKHEHKGFHCSVVSVQRNGRNSITITTEHYGLKITFPCNSRKVLIHTCTCIQLCTVQVFYPNCYCITLSLLTFHPYSYIM